MSNPRREAEQKRADDFNSDVERFLELNELSDNEENLLNRIRSTTRGSNFNKTESNAIKKLLDDGALSDRKKLHAIVQYAASRLDTGNPPHAEFYFNLYRDYEEIIKNAIAPPVVQQNEAPPAYEPPLPPPPAYEPKKPTPDQIEDQQTARLLESIKLKMLETSWMKQKNQEDKSHHGRIGLFASNMLAKVKDSADKSALNKGVRQMIDILEKSDQEMSPRRKLKAIVDIVHERKTEHMSDSDGGVKWRATYVAKFYNDIINRYDKICWDVKDAMSANARPSEGPAPGYTEIESPEEKEQMERYVAIHLPPPQYEGLEQEKPKPEDEEPLSRSRPGSRGS